MENNLEKPDPGVVAVEEYDTATKAAALGGGIVAVVAVAAVVAVVRVAAIVVAVVAVVAVVVAIVDILVVKDRNLEQRGHAVATTQALAPFEAKVAQATVAGLGVASR